MNYGWSLVEKKGQYYLWARRPTGEDKLTWQATRVSIAPQTAVGHSRFEILEQIKVTS